MLPRLLFTLLLFFTAYFSSAQTTIAQWNFNSTTPDANTASGSTAPSAGAGTILTVGGTTASFASGASNGGSSDPSGGTDNSGWGITGWPAQGLAERTAGIQFNASTAGYTDIRISFDLRHSNTSPRHLLLQYTLDATATTPVWVDFAVNAAPGGDSWTQRSFDLSAVTGLNDNPNAGFRVVSAFEPSTTAYLPANTGSTYSPGGNWRFDMVTVTGTSTGGDLTPPFALQHVVTSSTTSFIRFNEPVSTASAISPANYNFTPFVAVSGASLSATGDTVFLTHDPFADGQSYALAVTDIQDLALNTMAAGNFNFLFNGSLPNLVITEIIHSPNDIEMIEVYNAGASAVNLNGLKWTNGTTGSFPDVSLAAGATALFATSTATASSILNVPVVYPILNGLSSSDDILVIRNSLNQVIDSVSYFVGTNGWPVAPTGVYGYSFELVNAGSDNNLGSNWIVPANPVAPEPTQGVVRATPGVYPTPPYTPASATVSFSGSRASVSESTTTITITATLQNGGASAASADIELLPLGTAASGTDFTLPAIAQFSWPANAADPNATITITINNDALAEGAEYFIVRLANPVNLTLPGAASNHYTVFINDDDQQSPVATGSIKLAHIASFSNGTAGVNSAEIVAHDPASQRLFIANSVGGKIDIVNFSNPASASLINSVSITPYGNINSIAVRNGVVAAAVENSTPELAGKVVFFDINGVFLNQVEVGAMPDMITFNQAGNKVLTANEGQPNTTYTVDPEGSVSIIDISGGIASLTQANVTTAGFGSFNVQATTLTAAGVRIFGLNNPTVAQDMEPEYITVSADDQTAWVTCQENNAIATIDLATGTITDVRALGTKDHSLAGKGLDASDQGSAIQIANWPVKGLYLPDAVASYTIGSQTYLVTANEGDAREYNAYEEAIRVSSSAYALDPVAFPNAEALKANIGRLNVSKASGDPDKDGDYDEIHVFGSRSFSIWNATTGSLVWDSGDELELITSKHPVWGALFNASNANNTLKNRSDDKGPEPEGVTVAELFGKTYAFVSLERIGGCMVYDISDPLAPVYVDYINTRNAAAYGGDNGAEGIIYIDAISSPTGSPIVILANEVSSTLSFFTINQTILDITLAGIEARNEGSRNRLSWTTADEDPADVFEVERSRNGRSFTYMATLPARGTASSYTWFDEQPFEGRNYYRLKLKHSSGRISYSPIVSASMSTSNQLVQVYPNPVSSQLKIRLNGRQPEKALLQLVNASGIVVRTVRPTAIETSIDMSSLPAGLYTLQYSDETGMQSVKITKQ
ncbi:MAG TPA: choice-of-anchor I family protein [Flavisolibacter sp.]|nr:choice-of-anchor I family protein [Flavisolibacter sp.]